MTTRALIFILMSLMLAVCLPCQGFAATSQQALIAQAKAAVSNPLKDPNSVQWRDIVVKTVFDDKKRASTNVCGSFNAKNSFGAYVGFTRFIWGADDGKVLLPDKPSGDAALDTAMSNLFDMAFQGSCGAASSSPSRATSERFVQAADGLLQDTQTGLYWSQSDNGSDINWNDAKKYCAGKGFALPSADELEALYRTGTGTSCGDFTCKVSKLFRLTSDWGYFWSDTAYGSAEAWRFGLADGGRGASGVTDSVTERALCVRRR